MGTKFVAQADFIYLEGPNKDYSFLIRTRPMTLCMEKNWKLLDNVLFNKQVPNRIKNENLEESSDLEMQQDWF